MNRRLASQFLAGVLAGCASAASLRASDGTPTPGLSTTVTRVTTIQIGYPIYYASIVAPPPTPPTTVQPGTRVQFIAPAPGDTYGPVQWFKAGEKLPAGGATFEIAATTFADTGLYYAVVKRATGHEAGSDIVRLLVAPAGLRLFNFSSRVEIDRNHPRALAGFVVQNGPPGAGILLLVRAIGPTLATFHVNNVLAAPQLRVLDTRGRELPPYANVSAQISAAEAARRAGAFPLPGDTSDVARLYLLEPGAYALETQSADGGFGTALLEVYEVPL
jgi:hypothetical protein